MSRQYLFACFYSSGVVALTFVLTGSEIGIGVLLGPIAFVVALACTITLSFPFCWARSKLSEFGYFLTHLVGGVVVGIPFAKTNPWLFNIRDYVVGMPLLVICASMAAWLYIVCSSPANHGARRRHRLRARPVLLALGFALLALPPFMAPVGPFESNHIGAGCHSIMRYGRSSFRPTRIDVRLDAGRLDELQAFYPQFAAEYGMDIKKLRRNPGSARRSICNAGLNIFVGDIEENTQAIRMYEAEYGSAIDWVTTDFACRIEKRWPGSVTVTQNVGDMVPQDENRRPACP